MTDYKESLPAFRPARIAGDGDADSQPSEAPTHERRVPPVSFRTTPVANPCPGRSTTSTDEEAADVIRAVVSTWRMGL